MKISLINEAVSNGVYFFKDVKKPSASDRIKTIYDGSQFISDIGKVRDEVYEATSMTIIYNGKRTNIGCKDISPGSGRILVCIRNGVNNYEWKYLY